MLFNTSVPLQAIKAKIITQCTVLGCSWSREHQEKKSHQAGCEFVERKCKHAQTESALTTNKVSVL